MLTEDKVTELFCIADDFCKFFDVMMEKYTLKASLRAERRKNENIRINFRRNVHV